MNISNNNLIIPYLYNQDFYKYINQHLVDKNNANKSSRSYFNILVYFIQLIGLVKKNIVNIIFSKLR